MTASSIWYCYRPSPSQFPARVLLPMSLATIKKDPGGFGSKGKLHALIKEWRGRSFCFQSPRSPNRSWAGLQEGRGRGSYWAGAAVQLRLQIQVPGAASLHTARHRRHLELSVPRRASARSPEAEVPSHQTLWSEVPRAGPLPMASCAPGKLDEAQRKSKLKRSDFILLPRFYFYFPGLVNGVCW